jgi:hypothetical protein
MTKESIIVVHPFGDYHTELDPLDVEFQEFKSWKDMTVEQRAEALATQAPHDYGLNSERWVADAGHPFEWSDYEPGDYTHGELEPMGLGRLVRGDSNYTDYMRPVFRRLSQGE